MKNTKIKYLFIVLFTAFLTVQCDSDFEEVNTNPNNPTTAPSSAFLAGNLRTLANTVNNTGRVGEYAGTWVQQVQKAQYNDADLYQVTRSDMGNLWNIMYRSIGKLTDMQRLATTEGNKKMEAVAIILKSYYFQMATDTWGYAPYTEAAQFAEGNFTPVFDSPETIYEGLYNDLTNASNLLDMAGTIDPSQDTLYQGNAANWKAFANSLLFRLIMRGQNFANFDHTADLSAIAMNTFSGNTQEAKFQFLPAEPNANPYFEDLVQTSREAEWAIGEQLVHMMDGTLLGPDARLQVYAKPNANGNYVGLPAGLEEPGVDFALEPSQIGTAYVTADSYAYFITYAQVQLLKAEAVEKGYMGGSAATFYADGITASFANNGVGLAGYSTAYNGGAAGLQQIAEQEYIALFMQPLEAFAEWRRTGFPVLTVGPAAVLNEVPSRFLYPIEEESLNAANYQAALSAQGADVLTTHIAWMQ